MKRILYTLMMFCAVGLLSCRKAGTDITIKQFDADQIQAYIKSNNLTGMVRDTSGGDTSGIYYQVIIPGTGAPITYSTKTAFLYSAKSFDGSYNATDTIINHVYTYVAYVGPGGLQLAIKNIAKRRGAKIRVLVPSRLAYGVNGTTISRYTSATTTSSSTVSGNQCIDYTITVLDELAKVIVTNPLTNRPDTVLKQSLYDDISLRKYLTAQGFTGYTRIDTGAYKGLFYKVTKVGDGLIPIGIGSTVGVQYTGFLFNTAIFDQRITEGFVAASNLILYKDQVIDAIIGGLVYSLPKVTSGATVSIISPSSLGYGLEGSPSTSSFGIPPFSGLRFDLTVVTVTN